MSGFQITIDPALAREAQGILNGLGTDIPTAVSQFLRQTVRQRAIPFSVGDPNLYTEEELLDKHRRGVEAIQAGQGISVTMEQLEAMARDA